MTSYPGTVYFEGTNLTEGRGTDRPFEQIGASWLDAPRVVGSMNARKLPGIRFEAITMPVEPTAAKFKGLTIPGIRFVVTDRQAYRPVRTSLLLIDEIRRQHPRDFAWSRDDRSPDRDPTRCGWPSRAAGCLHCSMNGTARRPNSGRAADRTCSIADGRALSGDLGRNSDVAEDPRRRRIRRHRISRTEQRS